MFQWCKGWRRNTSIVHFKLGQCHQSSPVLATEVEDCTSRVEFASAEQNFDVPYISVWFGNLFGS